MVSMASGYEDDSGLSAAMSGIGSLPQAGWCEQAVRNQQPASEAGMWSPENINGTRLQGFTDSTQELYDFALFPALCKECEKVTGGHALSDVSLSTRTCVNPNFLEVLERGASVGTPSQWMCRNCLQPGFNFSLEVLEKLAQKEEWTQQIGDGTYVLLQRLRTYLNNQFLRLVEQGKVVQCFDEEGEALWACFCTGLLSRCGDESLYAILQRTPTQRQPWRWHSFVTQRQLNDVKAPWSAVEPILSPPDKATFIEDAWDLVYVAGPAGELPTLNLQDCEGWDSILERLPPSWESGVAVQGCKQSIVAAMQRTSQIMQQNPLAAVPQFYRPDCQSPGLIQMLLPLKLIPDSAEVHLALAVETSKSRRGARVYRAARLLSLDEAYVNARTIMPVHQPWLASSCSPSSVGRSLPLEVSQKLSDLHLSVQQNEPAGQCFKRSITSGSGSTSPQLVSLSSSNGGSSGFMTTNGRESPPSTFSHCGSPSAIPAASLSSGQTSRSGHTYVNAQSMSQFGSGSQGMTTGIFGDREGAIVGSVNAYEGMRNQASAHHVAVARRSPDQFADMTPMKGTSVALPLYAEALLQQTASNMTVKKAPSIYDALDFYSGRYDDLSPSCLMDNDAQMPVEVLQLSPIPGRAHPLRAEFKSSANSLSDMASSNLWANTGTCCVGASSMPNNIMTRTAPLEGGISHGYLHLDGGVDIGPSKDCGHGMSSGGRPIESCSGAYSPKGGTSWAWEQNREAMQPDYDRHREDEYVAFTPEDDMCPKINISQLPPRFVMCFLNNERPDKERIAEQHTEQCFGRYGMVARSLVRENKNHPGKWFAIVEFSYWTDDVVRQRLVAGEQIRFQNFYADEDVFIKRHRDKQNKVFRSGTAAFIPGQTPPSLGLQCRPDWKYTGVDTRAGKPLYKGPCTVCGRESTVPFKPVINGQPPRCRNCLPVQVGSGPDSRMDLAMSCGRGGVPSVTSALVATALGGINSISNTLASLSPDEAYALVTEGHKGASGVLRSQLAMDTGMMKSGFSQERYVYLKNQQRHLVEMG